MKRIEKLSRIWLIRLKQLKNNSVIKFLSAVIIACVSFSSNAFSLERYSSDVVLGGLYKPDKTLLNFIAELKRRVVYQDRGTLLSRVSSSFKILDDRADIYDPQASPRANFLNLFAIDGSLGGQSQEASWRYLSALLNSHNSYQKIEGMICTPANAKPLQSPKPEEFWRSWVYVNGTGVYAREAPSLKAEPVAVLSYVAVEPVSGEYGDRVKGRSGQGLWVNVRLPSGSTAYIHSSLLQNFAEPQLCFDRSTVGKWRVAGYVGGWIRESSLSYFR